MTRKMLQVSIILILALSYSSAQQLEHMIPVGYQSPFLKSGQFITSMYYNSYSTKFERLGDDIEGWTRFGEYSVNMVGYLGLTDNLTLSTKLFFYPKQNINWTNEDGNGENSNNFNVSPELTLSFRPYSGLEVFGTFHYQGTTTEYGPYTYFSNEPIGIDEDGNVIYELRERTMSPGADLETQHIRFKVGLTYSGRLW